MYIIVYLFSFLLSLISIPINVYYKIPTSQFNLNEITHVNDKEISFKDIPINIRYKSTNSKYKIKDTNINFYNVKNMNLSLNKKNVQQIIKEESKNILNNISQKLTSFKSQPNNYFINLLEYQNVNNLAIEKIDTQIYSKVKWIDLLKNQFVGFYINNEYILVIKSIGEIKLNLKNNLDNFDISFCGDNLNKVKIIIVPICSKYINKYKLPYSLRYHTFFLHFISKHLVNLCDFIMESLNNYGYILIITLYTILSIISVVFPNMGDNLFGLNINILGYIITFFISFFITFFLNYINCNNYLNYTWFGNNHHILQLNHISIFFLISGLITFILSIKKYRPELVKNNFILFLMILGSLFFIKDYTITHIIFLTLIFNSYNLIHEIYEKYYK